MCPAPEHPPMPMHEPAGYKCPFCALLQGVSTAVNHQDDIVARNETATALISPRWWPRNHGHVIIIPNAHHENIYSLPAKFGHGVHDLAREIAVAQRSCYPCTGTTIRQHNEPNGGQDVWHHHVHVFPRYCGDDLYTSLPLPGFATYGQRQVHAEKLRNYLSGR